MAKGIKVFITTKRFGDRPHYSNGVAGSLAEHTAQGAPFVKAASRLLEPIYGQGPGYKKAGVCLYDVHPARPHQLHTIVCSQNSSISAYLGESNST